MRYGMKIKSVSTTVIFINILCSQRTIHASGGGATISRVYKIVQKEDRSCDASHLVTFYQLILFYRIFLHQYVNECLLMGRDLFLVVLFEFHELFINSIISLVISLLYSRLAPQQSRSLELALTLVLSHIILEFFLLTTGL